MNSTFLDQLGNLPQLMPPDEHVAQAPRKFRKAETYLDPEQKVGPRGGNLENTSGSVEARRTSHNMEPEAQTGLPKLHRFEDTATAGLKNEQPWHRMAAFMLLAGRTNSEIGMAAGVTAQQVSFVRAQRWFQELMATLANVSGDEILGLLKAEAAASLEKLVVLRDNAESERIQLSAAQTLLEHAVGKPTQKIVSHTSHSVHATPEDEMRSIEEDLRVLRDRVKV